MRSSQALLGLMLQASLPFPHLQATLPCHGSQDRAGGCLPSAAEQQPQPVRHLHGASLDTRSGNADQGRRPRS